MSSICEVVPSFSVFTPGGLSKFTIGTYGISSSSKLIDSRLEGEDASGLPLYFYFFWLLIVTNSQPFW